ncbi:MAG TPA: hypothetical protein VKE69_00485 [Planctomycetota bacterium]|nr:hypothetical protein [Planctomycetota bacterium]
MGLALVACLACEPAQESRGAAPASRAVAVADLELDTPAIPGAPKPVVHRYSAGRAKGFAGLLLVSGWASGGGWFHRLASDLASRGGIEVWVLERRECFLEDRRVLDGPGSPAPQLGDETRKVVGALSLHSLCADVAFALEKMRSEGAASRFLGGWSATGPFLASFAAFDLGEGRRGSDLVDGFVAFDSDLHWPYESDAADLESRIAKGETYDSGLVRELVRLERAARAGTIAKELDPMTAPSELATLYDVRAGVDCPAERIAAVYLGPGRPHEWYFPRRYHADTFRLHARGLVWPEEGFAGIAPKGRRPGFVVLSRAILDGGLLPEGIEWFRREVAGGDLELVRAPDLGHAGILVADTAVRTVFDPLDRWLRARGSAGR